MSESNPQQNLPLAKAKAVLREQWPEVIQFMGDRATQAISSTQPSLRSTLNESNPSP